MVKAVDGVTFDVPRNTIVGLVGESGSARPPPAARCCACSRRPPAASCSTARTSRTSAKADAAVAPPHADRVPGSLRQPQPAHDGVRDPGRGAGHAQAGAEPPRGSHRRTAGTRRPERRPRAPLSARVLGRPAPAHRHRPRAGGGAGLHRGRRAGLGAGRVGPGAGAEPAAGPAARPGPDHAVRGPRPGGGGLPVRRSRGDVPGPRDGTRPHQRGIRPAAPLYSRPAVGRAGAGPARAALAHPAQGRHSQPGQPAVGLRVPHPLSARDRGLRRAAAAGGQCRPGASCGLYPPRRPRAGGPDCAPDPGPFP